MVVRRFLASLPRLMCILKSKRTAFPLVFNLSEALGTVLSTPCMFHPRSVFVFCVPEWHRSTACLFFRVQPVMGASLVSTHQQLKHKYIVRVTSKRTRLFSSRPVLLRMLSLIHKLGSQHNL